MADSDSSLFPFGGTMKKLFSQPAPRTRESLPSPPAGMDWVQNPGSKQWRLVKSTTVEVQTKLPPTPVSPVAESTPSQPQRQQSQKMPPRASPPTAPAVVVDRLPHLKITSGNKDDDWELLSDRLSSSSNHTPGGVCWVQHSGSVRSLNDANGDNDHTNSSSHTNTLLSVPFKIQRTASSSTIDSTDETPWPSGQGVLGVDYVEHVVLPTDTLQGICLAYKVSTTRLRQANHFSGNSLLLAPKKLVIPLSKKALRSGFIRVQDTDQKEYKIAAFLAEFPDFGTTEAKAYLELADWVLTDAIRSAREDGEWDEMDDTETSLRAGEIRIRLSSSSSGRILQTKGAGLVSSRPIQANAVPAIATKTLKAQDVYQAGVQQNTCGVELKSLTTTSKGE